MHLCVHPSIPYTIQGGMHQNDNNDQTILGDEALS